MKRINVLGIDLAKNIFQLHGNDENGNCILKKKLSRSQLVEFVAAIQPCLIGMEACGGAHHWARKFSFLGHEVKLMAPQYVKPYVKTNKNDANDAEAIAEAVTRPNMRFVPMKQKSQQDIQNLHRVRQRMIKNRTAVSNEIRGLLGEYGIVLPKNIGKLRCHLPLVLEDAENELTPLSRELISDLHEELKDLDVQVLLYDKKVEMVFKSNEVCQNIEKIDGVGKIVATAMVASVGDAGVFKNGRQFAAWLGLVPSQHSSGGKSRLGGISKRGDSYLRMLLVQGAKSALIAAGKKTDKKSLWLLEVEKRRGHNKACVALANKNARIIWALMARKEPYRRDYQQAV